MKIHRGYQRRLALTPVEDGLLVEQAHAARAMWNLLHDWYSGYGRGRRPSLKDADTAIREGRHDLPWLGVLPAQASQAVLKTYRRAWKNFFDGRAERPTFKSRAKSRMSVDVPQARDLAIRRVNRRWGEVNIPRLGLVRFRWSGPIPGVGREPGQVTGARVVKDAFGWQIVFRTEREAADPVPHEGPAVGIDRGVRVALALSDEMIRHTIRGCGRKKPNASINIKTKAIEIASAAGHGRKRTWSSTP